MRSICRPAAFALACLLTVALGCRRVGTAEDVQALAGEVGGELPPASAEPEAGVSGAPAGGEPEGFPLVSSPFPGLAGRLHSTLCDPASDPYSTCI